jgi:gluconate kinase
MALVCGAKVLGDYVLLIYIDADSDVRFLRINARLLHEGKEPITQEAFAALENDECEEELLLVREHIALHGKVINNTTISKEELTRTVDALLREAPAKAHQ